MTHEFKNQFNFAYDFCDFIAATGYKSPLLADMYNNFREFSYNYTLENGMDTLSECFEAWSKIHLTD